MKLEKAIESLEKHGVVGKENTWEDYLEAAQLGSEALKFVILIRTFALSKVFRLLPGETDE